MSLQRRGNSDPGQLDRRVSLYVADVTRDAVGGPSTAWRKFAEVWAAKKPLSGARLYAAEAKQGEDLVGFEIRHRTDVVPFMRLVHGDSAYEIIPPLAEFGRGARLDLICRAINQFVASTTNEPVAAGVDLP